jgi:alpha-beta hydrolase superfamily lysophospholipase
MAPHGSASYPAAAGTKRRGMSGRSSRALIVLLVVVIISVTGAAGSAVAGQHPGAVRTRVLRLTDYSRLAHFRDGTVRARVLITHVLYPSSGRPPYPLVVFAHGFALSPGIYAPLLEAWARAGYVVAAPEFPVEGQDAPGGPDQRDLPNEPGDLSFLVSQLTSRANPLRPLIDLRRIAVAGHSDGGIAALAAAYDRRARDRRIGAALILSGAAPPGFEPVGRGTPPVLAVQGTADTVNAPSTTAAYFERLNRPKFLLWLLGAPHLQPYSSSDDRWAPYVARTTTAFLDYYLRAGSLSDLISAGSHAGAARLEEHP